MYQQIGGFFILIQVKNIDINLNEFDHSVPHPKEIETTDDWIISTHLSISCIFLCTARHRKNKLSLGLDTRKRNPLLLSRNLGNLVQLRGKLVSVTTKRMFVIRINFHFVLGRSSSIISAETIRLVMSIT